MRPVASLLAAGAFACAACNDDSTGPEGASYDELCGEDEPLLILPLAAERPLISASGHAVADRYLFELDYGDGQPDSRELWSVGRCGESPTVLADDLEVLRFDEHWPDVPLICRRGEDGIFAVDPSGVREPNMVFESRGCFWMPMSQGLLAILGDGETGALVLQPWPDDPFAEAAEQVVLLDEVKARSGPASGLPSSEHDVLAADGDAVLAVSAEDELVEVALDDFETTVLATGVREFRRGASGRWIVLQGVEVTADGPDGTEGPIFVLDRETDDLQKVDETALSYSGALAMALEPLGVLYYRVKSDEAGLSSRYRRLPGLELFELPVDVSPVRVIDDTRALFVYPLSVVDTLTGEVDVLYDGSFDTWRAGSEGLLVLREPGGELLRFSLLGEERTLAQHATSGWQLASGERVVTVFNPNADDVGALVVVDPDSLEETYVDYDVLSRSLSLVEDDEDGLVVSYAVVETERRGIWLASPAR